VENAHAAFSCIVCFYHRDCTGSLQWGAFIKRQGAVPGTAGKKLSENALAHFFDFNYKKAIDTYGIILERTNAEPSYRAWAQYETGFCYYYLKDFKRAKTEFEKVILEYPQPQFASQRVLAEMLIKKIDTGNTDGI
jgi:tetratricopeptide (TPR) repeat protein